MSDHGKFGVSDYAASKAFFLKALELLGVAVVSEEPPTYGVELAPRERRRCACTGPTKSRRIFTRRSVQEIATRSMRSIARRWQLRQLGLVRAYRARQGDRRQRQPEPPLGA